MKRRVLYEILSLKQKKKIHKKCNSPVYEGGMEADSPYKQGYDWGSAGFLRGKFMPQT